MCLLMFVGEKSGAGGGLLELGRTCKNSSSRSLGGVVVSNTFVYSLTRELLMSVGLVKILSLSKMHAIWFGKWSWSSLKALYLSLSIFLMIFSTFFLMNCWQLFLSIFRIFLDAMFLFVCAVIRVSFEYVARMFTSKGSCVSD